jgi:hypothetical protein
MEPFPKYLMNKASLTALNPMNKGLFNHHMTQQSTSSEDPPETIKETTARHPARKTPIKERFNATFAQHLDTMLTQMYAKLVHRSIGLSCMPIHQRQQGKGCRQCQLLQNGKQHAQNCHGTQSLYPPGTSMEDIQENLL